ncbi:hypothetical protein [Sporosarcina sp.]|nr:hypothetical protein [Sporosarcina sp.]
MKKIGFVLFVILTVAGLIVVTGMDRGTKVKSKVEMKVQSQSKTETKE